MKPKKLIAVLFALLSPSVIGVENTMSAEEYFQRTIGMVIATEAARDKCSVLVPAKKEFFHSSFNHSAIKQYSNFLLGTVAHQRSLMTEQDYEFIGKDQVAQTTWCKESYQQFVQVLDSKYKDGLEKFKKDFGYWVAKYDSELATSEKKSKIKIYLFKNELFCTGKHLQNWRDGFTKYCNPLNDRRIDIIADTDTSSEFLVDVIDYIKKQINLVDKRPVVSVSSKFESSIKSELERCLANKECRL